MTAQALAQLWDKAVGQRSGVAMGAVGSLARGELSPMSDLDLVVIHDGWPAGDLEELARELWYPLWDAGLDLDQSIRCLAGCRRVASNDVPAATGLISLQPVAGDAGLLREATSAVLTDWRSNARRRFKDVAAALGEREERFGELAYRLEPDLKEARGGLRDVVALDALVATWLADRPHGELDRYRAHVLDVRDALHLVTGRPGHQLLMADQAAVAEALGFGGPDELLSSLAGAGRAVRHGLDTTLRRAQGALPRRTAVRPVMVRGRRTGPRLTVVADGVAELAGELVLTGDPLDPVAPLRAARAAATKGLPLEPLTALALAKAPELPAPWPAPARAELNRLLGAGNALVAVWETLDQSGVIGRLFPEWDLVRNLVQRNPLHRHTVDRHQVEAVAELGRLDVGRAPRELVQLAGLFHDLGKANGTTDHGAAGAELAQPIFQRLGYAPDQVAFMAVLVRHHLLLADLATSRDVRHPATAESLAAALDGDGALLDGREALTEADARAAGPRTWTAGRAALVHTLATATRTLLG
jgi:[protein-PII] uridylyltransferase